MNPTRRDRYYKIGMIVMSFFLIFDGTVAMIESRWTYSNYWGGQVFAPVTILFGVLLIFIVLFRFDALKKSGVNRKGRKIRFPADDFRKW